MNRTERLKRLRELLEHTEAELFVTTREIDIYYFTGNQCEGIYLATRGEEILITDPRYIDGVSSGDGLKVECAASSQERLKEIAAEWQGKKTAVPFSERFDFISQLKKMKLKIKPVDVDSLRAIKDVQEIRLIKDAYRIIEKSLMAVIPHIREGIREKDLEAELVYQIRKLGADSESFPAIIAFGENSAIPHARTGMRRLKKGDVILIDAGCRVKGYCSDITRCLAFGDPDDDVERFYSYLQGAFKRAVDKLEQRPVFFKSIDRAARRYLESRGLGQYFTHSLGHGIGLEVHERPYLSAKSRDRIKSGMVFTIEPGVYFTGKFGLRLENAVYLADNPVILTNFTQNLVYL